MAIQGTKMMLKAKINQAAWKPSTAVSPSLSPSRHPAGRIAVQVINHLGNEVMKVFRVE